MHVISALRDKRSELAGIVSRLEQQLVTHRASLTHVDATMLLFDPDIRPEEIRPRRQRTRNSWFRLGECLRLVYDVLRDTPEPVTTREIAERIMAVKAIPATEDRRRELISENDLWFARSNEEDDRARRGRGGGPVAADLGGLSALPVAAEVDRWPASHRLSDNAVCLLAVTNPAEVLPPGCLLSVAREIWPGDMMMMAEFAPAQAREVGFGAIGAGASDAVALLVVDPPHGELGVQRVPGRALVGMNQGSLRDPLTNGRHSSLFSREHLRQRAAFTLAHHHNDLAFTGLVLGEPAVDPAGSQVLRPDMAAEAGAVDLSRSSLATDAQRFRAGRNGLAQLVRQHKRGLVLDIEISGESEHALALDLVAEGSDGKQIGPERQLVPSEQSARGNREITAARFAAPSRTIRRSAARVAHRAAAARTHRLAIGLGPAQAKEHVLDAPIGHTHDLGGAERTRRRRKQEVLRHEGPTDEMKIRVLLASIGGGGQALIVVVAAT